VELRFRTTDLNQNSKIMKKQLTALCMVTAMLVSTSLIAQDDREDRGDFHLDETYEISATGTLHLNSEDADIRITGSNRSDVHVKIDRDESTRGVSSRSRSFKVEVENRNGDLHVTEKRGRSGGSFTIGSYSVKYDITIELPESASLRIKGEDDDYYVKNVNGKISIETEDGDVELNDCNGDQFDIRLEDGDLRMDGGQGDLYLRMDDGDADVRNGKFESMEVTAEDGSVSIETEVADGGNYEIRTDDSNVEFIVLNGGGEFTISKDDGRIQASSEFDLKRETDYREEYVLSGGSAEIDIRVNDGRVRLSKK
jgi:DUF4097 and DUF4098 domain-containing protein YvlB